MSTPMLWDDLRRLHKIVGHLLAAANEIDEFGVGMGWGPVSEALNERQGVTLRKLRECCDEMCRIKNEEQKRAQIWEETHMRYKPGDRVRTVEVPDPPTDWAAGVAETRKFGVEGVVQRHSDSHGLCYEVLHDDGTKGWYEHRELFWIDPMKERKSDES